jgi:hypothetical protein
MPGIPSFRYYSTDKWPQAAGKSIGRVHQAGDRPEDPAEGIAELVDQDEARRKDPDAEEAEDGQAAIRLVES